MFSASLAVILAAATAGVDAPKTYLASLTNLPLRSDERLESFSIETWGVTFNAVCQIPAGWRIKAGGSAAPDGVVEGESTQGTTRLGDVTALEGLVLLTVHGPVQERESRDSMGGTIPATFTGQAIIIGPSAGREVTLSARNIRLTAATSCPVPKDRITPTHSVARR